MGSIFTSGNVLYFSLALFTMIHNKLAWVLNVHSCFSYHIDILSTCCNNKKEKNYYSIIQTHIHIMLMLISCINEIINDSLVVAFCSIFILF